MTATTMRKQKEYSEKIKLIPELVNATAKHEKEIERVTHYMFGNGEPGMDERIRNIERSLSILVKLAWIATSTIGGYVGIEIFKVVF